LIDFKEVDIFFFISGHSSVVERLVANEVVHDFFSLQSLVNFNHTHVWSHYGTQLVLNYYSGRSINSVIISSGPGPYLVVSVYDDSSQHVLGSYAKTV
jgi:hypothetical protein